MDTIGLVIKVGLYLIAFWVIALSIGAFFQLKQAFQNWIEGTHAPIKNNPIFDLALKVIGVQHGDRLVFGIWIPSALILWPVTLIVAPPAILAYRARTRRKIAKLQIDHGSVLQAPAQSKISKTADDAGAYELNS